MAVNVWEPSVNFVEPSVVTTTVVPVGGRLADDVAVGKDLHQVAAGDAGDLELQGLAAGRVVQVGRLAAGPASAGKKVRLVGAAGITAANGLADKSRRRRSGWIVTVNVCGVGVLVPSLAITVTVTVPVAPVGALSSSTPFCVSVNIEAELIVTGVDRYPMPLVS